MFELSPIGCGRRVVAGLVTQVGRALRAPRRPVASIAVAIVAATGVVGVGSGLLGPATASATAKTALVFGPSVIASPTCSANIPYASFTPSTGGAHPCGEVASLQQQGWTVTVDTAAQWDATSQATFATYQLLVFGDPYCGSVTTVASAVSNESTWAPVVDGTVLIIGTDPMDHGTYLPSSGQTTPDPAKLVYQGLAYAGAQAGKTGLYLDLSCYYAGSAHGTPAPILDGIEAGFSVTGATCTSSIHVVAAAQQLIGVTDPDLSNWGCSTHEYLYTWPSDFVPYALDTNVSDTCPTRYSPPDGTASGCPYIVARGGGITAGGVTLSGPPTGAAIGSTQTLTAAVELNGSPVNGASVIFTAVSGPDVGNTTTVTTDAAGNASYSYSSASAGTDEWQAAYTPSGRPTETSSDAAVVWNQASTSVSASSTPTSTGYGNTVQLSASGLPSGATGSVSFIANSSPLCSGTLTTGSTSCMTTLLAPGTYSVTATYPGDSNYLGSTASTSFTINAADGTPTNAVADAADNLGWHGTETVGAGAYDTASVATAGGGSAPTGTLTYNLYTNVGCTGSPTTNDQVTLSGGNVPSSSTAGPLAAGGYSYQAVYSGDSNYAAGTSSCTAFAVAQGTPTLDDAVVDAAGPVLWSGSETAGASAYDTATVTGVGGITPTGTLTYNLYANGGCSAVPVTNEQVTLSIAGDVPNSSATTPLAAGGYSYQAVYSGDSNYAPGTSSCAAFAVAQVTPALTGVVQDAAGSVPWDGSELTGARAYDTATVTGVGGFTATGTLTYNLYANGGCSGNPTASHQVTLSGGNVPNSSTTAPLAAGHYSYGTTYSGDPNYNGANGACQPFDVANASSSTTAAVNDAGSNGAWAGSETVGASAYATATVSGPGGFTPAGTVTYSVYAAGNCAGTALTTDAETLASGNVPNSSATAPLAAGTYNFQASYSGDANFTASTSPCEPITVGQGSATTSGSVEDASANNAAWSGSEANGSSAVATASVTGVSGFASTGTVTYTLFDGSSCTGAPVSIQTVTLANGKVADSTPTGALSTGSYSFQAAYSGDTNYTPATGSCEPFAVLAPLPSSTAATPAPPSLAISLAGVTVTGGASGGSGGSNPGAMLHISSGKVVAAHYSCQDASGGPGIASCVGSVANGAPLNTTTLGVHSFTVTSTSTDGQTATRTISYVVVPNSYFTIRHLVVHPNAEHTPDTPDEQDGIVAFDLTASGPGKVTVLETAPPHSAPGAASTGKAHRVIYGTATMTARRAGTLHVEITPNAIGKQLLAEHQYFLWIEIRVTFRPTGGKPWSQMFYGNNAALEPPNAH